MPNCTVDTGAASTHSALLAEAVFWEAPGGVSSSTGKKKGDRIRGFWKAPSPVALLDGQRFRFDNEIEKEFLKKQE
jgi:hypothetical protein